MSLASRLQEPALSIGPRQRRAFRDGLILAGFLANLALLAFLPRNFAWFVDAPAWWLIDLSNLYSGTGQSLEGIGVFRFAPVVAWLMWPMTLLPWAAFLATYVALNVAAVVALGRRWAPVLVLAFPPVLLEVINGNIHLFMAFAIWIGMRWPWAWSFLLLTKVTPGIGVLWFAARQEWRSLAVALGATALIVAIGFLIAGEQWRAWFEVLLVSSALPQVGGLPPLLVRLPVAAVVVIVAARTDRAWLVPIGCLLAMPTIWLQSAAILTACFPLYWERDRFRRHGFASSTSDPIHGGAAT